MQKERLQILKDALVADGRVAWDLSGYDTCITTLIIRNPTFNALGFVPPNLADYDDIPTYGGLDGVNALAHFFEISVTDACRLTHAREFPRTERDSSGHVLTSAILARINALLGVTTDVVRA